MTTTPTTNYAWLMPDVGSEVDTWGTVMRTLLQAIDTEMFNRIGKPAANAVSVVAGSAANPGLGFQGDVDTGLYHPGANQVGLSVNGGGSTAIFDGNGFVISPAAGLQTLSIESNNNTAQIVVTGAVASAPIRSQLTLRKNRNGLVVVTGDVLGGIVFQGADGAANYQEAGRITVLVEDATPGPTFMGGRYQLKLAPKGSITPTQAFDVTIDTGVEYLGNLFLDLNRLFQFRNTTFAGVPAGGANGKVTQLSDNGGFLARHNGTAWCHVNNPTVQTVNSDVDFTITPNSSGQCVRHIGTLTAARAVTLGTGQPGDWCQITRSGGGAFNLNVGTGPLKALATNTWGEFRVNSVGTWYLAAYGAL